MLQLRPSCENCQIELAPNSPQAMICSYECTFCSDCVTRLNNVCPNCGGGFVPRPIRPSKVYIKGTSLLVHPASNKKIHKAVNFQTHIEFAKTLKNTKPEER